MTKSQRGSAATKFHSPRRREDTKEDAKEIRNLKPEIRRNDKSPKSEGRSRSFFAFFGFRIWDFIRISGFGFPSRLASCLRAFAAHFFRTNFERTTKFWESSNPMKSRIPNYQTTGRCNLQTFFFVRLTTLEARRGHSSL